MMEDAMGGFALPVAVADAAFLGNLVDVRKFLSAEAGAVNSRCWDRDNGTLLLSAAVGGQHGLVRFLLNRCATVDQENSVGLTPLQAAACQQPGNKETIEMLMEAGANIEAGNPHDGTTALIYAAELGTVDAAQALLSGGATVDAAKRDGGTALMAASHRGHLELVQALIAARAALDKQNDEGATALMGAAQQGHAPVVVALLRARADPSLRALGRTALEWAREEGHQDVVAVLRRHATTLEVAAARARTVKAEAAARAAAADVAMAALLEEERLLSLLQDSTPPPTLGKGKKGKGGKKGAAAEPSRKERQERQSCPCDATRRPYSPEPQGKAQEGKAPSCGRSFSLPSGRVIDEATATGAEARRPSVDIADSARQRLFGEVRFQHSCLPVTDKVQRFLEALGESVAEEDKRAAAALLLARRRRPSRHERHSV